MLLGFGLLHRPQAYPSAAGKTIGCNYLVAFKTRFHLARTIEFDAPPKKNR